MSQIKLDFNADNVPWQCDLDQVLCIYIYVCMYVYVHIYISSWGNLELQAVDSTYLSHKVVTLEDALNTILDKYQLLLLCYNERSNRGRNTVQWTFQTSRPSFLKNMQSGMQQLAHGHTASNWQLNWKLSIPKAELKSLPSLAMAVSKVCPERIK